MDKCEEVHNHIGGVVGYKLNLTADETEQLLREIDGLACEHDWQDEYYGTRCKKCNAFYPFGSEPWMPDDPALAELQAMETNGDDLLDAGVMPINE